MKQPMQIKLKGTNLELTSDIENYAEEKIRSVEKFINPKDPDSVMAYVELEKTTDHHQSGDDLYRAEVNLDIDGQYYRAESSASDVNAAIDEVKDEIEQVVKSRQAKAKTKQRKGGQTIKKLLRGFYRK